MIRNRRSIQSQTGRREESRDADRPAPTSRVLASFCLCLLSIALVTGGCATGSSYEKLQYILETVRQGDPVRSPLDGSLEVHRFSVDAAFAAKSLVYRLGEFEYEVDYYRQFLIAPGTMITERTRDWLADSGLFTRVLPVGSRVAPSYTLEGNVTALYGDFSNKSAAAAVMEIRFFLLDNADSQEKIAFAETYRAATPVRDRSAEVFVEALDDSLAEILTRLEVDLQKVLAGRADTGGSVQGL